MKDGFKIELGARVVIEASGEEGVVVGRAQYATAENSYLVRYCAGDGRAVEAWWGESAVA